MRARQGSGRTRPRSLHALALALAVAGGLAAAPAAAQDDEVRIVGVEPARTDSTLECTVVTSGFPGVRARETLASGLPSSLTLFVSLLDASGRERAVTQAEIRIEPDPWERTFVVRAPFALWRSASLEELASHLRRLGPLVISRARPLEASGRLRLRVRLAAHPLAPPEADRAHSLFVGDMGANGADRREVSAGVGSLLRYFLGRTPVSEGRVQATSAPFEFRSLPREH